MSRRRGRFTLANTWRGSGDVIIRCKAIGMSSTLQQWSQPFAAVPLLAVFWPSPLATSVATAASVVHRTAGVCWKPHRSMWGQGSHGTTCSIDPRDNKQQELTSLTLETPLPTRIALIGYTGQYDAVGKPKTVRST